MMIVMVTLLSTCSDGAAGAPAAAGRCEVDFMGRMSELQRRNSLMPPHLRSRYAPEINVPGQATALMTENELRVGDQGAALQR